MYIKRELHSFLVKTFQAKKPRGIIVAGVVGCGKTTLIHEALRELGKDFVVFEFTGDDVAFRRAVNEDTAFINRQVRSRTQAHALVFVDEIQKSENIFDAIKYAFDKSEVSFIVSGSNPAYLNTQAKQRLQRRADLMMLQPFSLPEILMHQGLVSENTPQLFREIFAQNALHDLPLLLQQGLSLTPEIEFILDRYLVYGGLPLAWLVEPPHDKLVEIRKVVERGFENMSQSNDTLVDLIRVELARLHSCEFGYQGLFQKTGVRRRDIVNQIIDDLINHGYVIKKKPVFFEDKRSYLSVFTFSDSGFVTYLTGRTDLASDKGLRVEGIVHTRLWHLLQNHMPLKSQLGYYKPYSIDGSDKVKFKPGEIDFVVICGEKIVPIEAKATWDIGEIQIPILEQLIAQKNLKFGVVLYKGVPQWDAQKKILYWPYWAV